MTIAGTYTFSAPAEKVWDVLLDLHMLLQIVPGLQTIDIGPDGEIRAEAVVGLGPIKGRIRAKLHLLEQQKPMHVKIMGDAQGGPGQMQGTCIIDATELDGSTTVRYRAEARVSGIPSGVSDRLVNTAILSLMRRVDVTLNGAAAAPAGQASNAAMSNLGRAAQTWDEIDIDKVRQVAWSSIQHVSQSCMRDFSGADPASVFVHQLLARRLGDDRAGLKGAALVCGDMVAERAFFEPDDIVRFSEVDGFDISAASLAKYKPEKIRFNPHVADGNNLILERDRYDLVVACHGAHHVYNLGNLFYQANKSLKREGLFYMVEWMGPEYLQIPRTNHLFATLLLLGLFDRKTRTTHMGQVKGLRVQDPPEAFDPSEACNSTELVPQFLKYFRPIRTVRYAGLAYPIFEGIAQNIDQATRMNQIKIRIVHRLERMLTRLGIVKPLFVMALGEKKEHDF
jgi:carbon monoxide dehydrogenase subunit G/SAM-dependent methyltransferase